MSKNVQISDVPKMIAGSWTIMMHLYIKKKQNGNGTINYTEILQWLFVMNT